MDAISIGKRIYRLRMYSGLSREEFGKLFNSEECTVYQWECGRCVPMLSKLLAISHYFNVSLDSILKGEALGENMLEEELNSASAQKTDQSNIYGSNYARRIMVQFNSLSDSHKERLIGYLDALSKESNTF